MGTPAAKGLVKRALGAHAAMGLLASALLLSSGGMGYFEYEATVDGDVNRTATPEQRAGVRSGEPASRERLGEVEFERLVDADHRAQPQQLILGQLPRETRLLGALPGAL